MSVPTWTTCCAGCWQVRPTGQRLCRTHRNRSTPNQSATTDPTSVAKQPTAIAPAAPADACSTSHPAALDWCWCTVTSYRALCTAAKTRQSHAYVTRYNPSGSNLSARLDGSTYRGSTQSQWIANRTRQSFYERANHVASQLPQHRDSVSRRETKKWLDDTQQSGRSSWYQQQDTAARGRGRKDISPPSAVKWPLGVES